MNPRSDMTMTAQASAFDLFRSRLETEVTRPAVFVITSSSPIDYKEIAARNLASSFAIAGYTTLYLDTAPDQSSISRLSLGLGIQDVARQVKPPGGAFRLTSSTFTDSRLQRASSQRDISSALEILRANFDYVVVNTEHGVTSSFANSLFASAEGILVAVKSGRRHNRTDRRLADILNRYGESFLGVLALDTPIMSYDSNIINLVSGNSTQGNSHDKDRQGNASDAL